MVGTIKWIYNLKRPGQYQKTEFNCFLWLCKCYAGFLVKIYYFTEKTQNMYIKDKAVFYMILPKHSLLYYF